jgi:putative transposase
MLEDAEADILAFYPSRPASGASCAARTRSSASTRRSAGAPTVVGIFPDDRSLIRLAGMLCIEQTISWLVGCGYLSAESISLVLAGPDDRSGNKEVAQLQAA